MSVVRKENDVADVRKPYVTQEELAVVDRQLRKQIGDLEEAVRGLAIAMQGASAEGEDVMAESGPRVFRDAFWKCEKCGAKLAVYDREADQLRVKHRSHMAWFDPGEGGRMTIACHGCGHLNTITTTAKRQPQSR